MPRIRFTRIALTLIAGGLLTACAPQQHFVWGAYEYELYGYYTDPQRLENLMQALDEAIAQGEAAAAGGDGAPRRIAPGLYAEYGYLLMLRNEGTEAKSYFQKEKQTWPESSVLMDKMIAVIDRSEAGASATGLLETKGSTE